MIDDDVKAEFKKLDERLGRVEQILPTLATKDDLKAFATKDDAKAFATKDDLRQERRELNAVIATLATKDDLRAFATKDDLQEQRRELDAVISTLATKAEMGGFEERIRRHFDVVAESLRDEMRLGFEGHIATTSRLETLEHRHRRLERRVTALEGPVPRRKK